MRLIDADALLEEINDLIQIWSGGEKDLSIGHHNGLESAKEYIDDAPTIDAEPVRHGHWIRIGTIDSTWLVHRCSICGYQTIDNGQYCTNCGARMDEVNDE